MDGRDDTIKKESGTQSLRYIPDGRVEMMQFEGCARLISLSYLERHKHALTYVCTPHCFQQALMTVHHLLAHSKKEKKNSMHFETRNPVKHYLLRQKQLILGCSNHSVGVVTSQINLF
jgi:hypothetical protein